MYFVNRRHGYLYASTPKVACTSLKAWHAQAMQIPVSRQGGEFHDWCDQSESIGRVEGAEARDALNDPSLMKFAFVRHPLSRLVSAYRDKVLRADGPGCWAIKRGLRGRWWNLAARIGYAFEKWRIGEAAVMARGVTFRQFAQLIISEHPAALDVHWRPQTQLFAAEKLDFIGRLETFAADFATLQAQLNLSLPAPELNRRSRSTENLPASSSAVKPNECLADVPASVVRKRPAPLCWRAFYDDPLAAQVSAFYRVDIDTFRYVA